ncbi:hypothetical protein ACFE04_005746 [Oxalis oulophora]
MNSICRAFAQIGSSQPSRQRLLLLCSQLYSTSLKVGTDHDWPKPKEIPFQPKVANSVNLIGYVHMPVKSTASDDGKYWAGTIIGQDATSNSPPLWVQVIFEGDLARTAASYLKENDRVYITGQVITQRDDPLSLNESHGQTNLQVMAHSVNFVDIKMKNNSASVEKEEGFLKHSVSVSVKNHGDPNLDSWKNLVHYPKQWRDYRATKLIGSVKPKHPDFKHKERGHSLWLDDAPEWVSSKIENLEFDNLDRSEEPKLQNSAHNSKQAKLLKDDELWKDVLKNQSKWWDNRLNKKNKNSPDFKHKDTGEALWLDSSPDWVKHNLPSPKSKDNKRCCVMGFLSNKAPEKS